MGLVAIQLGVIAASPWELLVRITLPATIAVVPLALWPHRQRIGVWVMAVGLAANLAVVLANGGLMPIERPTVASAIGDARAERYDDGAWIRGSKDVLSDSGHGHALALGDSIVVPLGSRGLVASPGDVVILAGLALIAAEAAWLRFHAPRRTATYSLRIRTSGGGATTPGRAAPPYREACGSEGKSAACFPSFLWYGCALTTL